MPSGLRIVATLWWLFLLSHQDVPCILYIFRHTCVIVGHRSRCWLSSDQLIERQDMDLRFSHDKSKEHACWYQLLHIGPISKSTVSDVGLVYRNPILERYMLNNIGPITVAHIGPILKIDIGPMWARFAKQRTTWYRKDILDRYSEPYWADIKCWLGYV